MPVHVTEAHRQYAVRKFQTLDYRDLPEVRLICVQLLATREALSAAEARAERAEAALADAREALTLVEHKADQALQGQYTPQILLGVILQVSREGLLKSQKPQTEVSK